MSINKKYKSPFPVIVIPAYQPGANFPDLVEHILSFSKHIIVVDDGSSESFAKIFQQVSNIQGVDVLRHETNLGKGQALKTAFNFFLQNSSSECPGVVSVDADGQHLPEDVKQVYEKLAESPAVLWLGSRKFEGKIPLRSQLGNNLTRKVFRLLTGYALQDTQTGLRGIPRVLLPDLLTLSSTGYDFEMEMLMRSASRKIPVKEIWIQTVYLEDNRSSHFNPLYDSLKIYFVLLRFFSLSMVTAFIDFVVFSFVHFATSNILFSTSMARVVAGVFNFTVAKKMVFRSKEKVVAELIKYVSLVVFLMLVSYGLVTCMVIFLGVNVYLSKIVIESSLFLASFAIQRVFVFRQKDSFSVISFHHRTDWDSYYKKPNKIAGFTRKITERKLIAAFDVYTQNPVNHICELGGANSCFYDAIRDTYPTVRYTVIDNNQIGLDMLRNRHRSEVEMFNNNILQMSGAYMEADVVFSVGLIEHFSEHETAQAIKAHFLCGKPGAIVIITFPTYTWLYQTIRFIAEKTGRWIFHDERPLPIEDVKREMSRYGRVLDSYVNWKTLLTQGVIVVRAEKTGKDAEKMMIGKV